MLCCYYNWGRSAWLESKDFRSSGDEGVVVLMVMTLNVYFVIKAPSAPDCIQECPPPLSLLWLCVYGGLPADDYILLMMMVMMIRP